MRKFVFLFSLVFISAFTETNAQSKNAENYHKASESIRKQVWAWDRPQFKVRTVPPQYANASKVVLAHHTELTADSKSKFVFLVVTAYTKKEETITEVVRELVKINDKNAVDDYSELSFTQFAKRSGFFTSAKTTTYVGVLIIKPIGRIK
jgi:hypothetical protein